LFSRDEHDGGWVFKEYLEDGTGTDWRIPEKAGRRGENRPAAVSCQ